MPGNSKKKTSLLALPDEIIADIGMFAGFFAALSLASTCSRLQSVFLAKSSWHTYSKVSADDVSYTVTITTKLNSFDHLIFGTWNKKLFFSHKTFNERLDHLGGITVSNEHGMLQTEYFDHRETLECYFRDIHDQTLAGALPPVLNPVLEEIIADITGLGQIEPRITPTFNTRSIGGQRIAHSCVKCSDYDSQVVLKDIFILDQIPVNPTWQTDGFSEILELKDGTRVNFRVMQVHSAFGHGSDHDLPWVCVENVVIGGRRLSASQRELFHRLTHKSK